MVLCPPSPGSQLLRAGLGAGLAQTEVLDGSPNGCLDGILPAALRLFRESPGHTPVSSLYLTASSLWEGTVPSPSLAHDGSTQDVLGS